MQLRAVTLNEVGGGGGKGWGGGGGELGEGEEGPRTDDIQ